LLGCTVSWKRDVGGPMTLKNRCLIALVALGVLDAVIPLPIIGLILVSVALARRPWLLGVVQGLYHG